MKRKEAIRFLESQGCVFLREGARHTVFYNPQNNKTSTMPRHTEIDDFLFKKICKDLEIKSK